MVACMYRQSDGYPDGHGDELATFLTGIELVDGLTGGDPERVANGMDCLAAQIVAHFKTRPGAIYLYPTSSRDCGEEWVYLVYNREGKIGLAVFTDEGYPDKALWDGPVVDFNASAIQAKGGAE